MFLHNQLLYPTPSPFYYYLLLSLSLSLIQQSVFQDNLVKLVLEQQTILDVNDVWCTLDL